MKQFFNGDFYPTPENVIFEMLQGVVIEDKIILEPSAGAGNIVTFLQAHGAKEVLSCEKDEDLQKILTTKCRIINNDFLQVKSEDISHIELIVMNPPFNRGEQHINHAWSIAPAGCKIIALCNAETLKNTYSKGRERLSSIIEEFGQWRSLGSCFNDADRQTGVEIGLIELIKPGESYKAEFEGFFMGEDPQEEQVNGIMSYNLIRDLVNRYVEAVKIYDEQLKTAVKLNGLINVFHNEKLGFQCTNEKYNINRNTFKKDLQKSAWSYIFNKMDMQKFATKGLKEDINKFVETQTQIPFTMRNVYQMLQIVIGTQGQRMDKAILEVFDKVTQHHHENRHNVEGWKTNSHYLLGKRFIFPNLTEVKWGGGIGANYSSNFEMIEDLIKALCYVTGDNYAEKISIYDSLSYTYFLTDSNGKPITGSYGSVIKESTLNKICDEQAKVYGSKILTIEKDWGKWFETDFFRIRCYKKGTMHFEFKDESVWSRFNQAVAKIKGYPLYEYNKYEADKRNKKEQTKSTFKTEVLESISF